MNFGDLYWVNLEDTHPPEFGKTRPGLIVSNSSHNRALSTVVIVPLSTRPGEIWPLRLEIYLPVLLKKSYAILPGIRQVNKHRLFDYVGPIDFQLMRRVQDALQAYLSP